jgi:uncharacterized protein
LLQQIETVIKLIRSKGIGIFFCTQNPQDIPASILSQLGMKIQHALRAFTAADRKTIKQAAENFPETTFYQTDEILTQLGIGEALVTLLNEKGIPTPLVHTMLCAPRSRMDVLTDSEIDQLVSSSKLASKYSKEIDNESAYEMLTAKLEEAAERNNAEKDAIGEDEDKEQEVRGRKKKEEGFFDNPVVRQVGRTAASVLTRTLLGALGLGGRSRITTSRSRRR